MSDRTEKMRQYRRNYWQRYKQKNRRVYGTLSKDEYAEIAAIAQQNGRSVWGEVWHESHAYRRQQFVPSREIERRIEALYGAMRQIGNNLNQIAHAQNIVGKMRQGTRVIAEVSRLEQVIEDFVSRPWRVSNDRTTENGDEL